MLFTPPLQATCGTLGLSTATVKLIGPDGEEKIACSVGTGPVDAAYKAVDQIIQVRYCHIFLTCLPLSPISLEVEKHKWTNWCPRIVPNESTQ